MYSVFYCFSEKPFEVTPDPKFLYFTPTHREALNTMINSIKNRTAFVLITGEVGTGKTNLIYALLIRLGEKVKTVFIFNPSITFVELLKNILQELDQQVIGKTKEALLTQLNKYLLDRLDEDETLALIIDEAQHLRKEVMEELGRLEEMIIPWISNRLQITFVGQPEFEEKLNSPGLRDLNQKTKIKCQIKPLTEEESREYIDHRLKIAGSSSSRVFTPDAISRIVHHAKGVPRVINILCDNAFRIGYGLFRKRVDVDIIHQVIREMEGSIPQKSIPLDPLSPLKKFHWMPLRHIVYHKRIFLVLISLICVIGVILLIRESLKQKLTNTWSIGSIMKPRIDTEVASKGSLSQTTKQEILEAPFASSQQDSKSQELLQPIAPPPPGSSSHKHEEGASGKVIVVQKGQTISSLAQKYYHMLNPTLVDLILQYNPEITNADLIQIGQTITIPEITEECLIKKSPNSTFKIYVGTFWIPGSIEPYKNELVLKGKRIEVFPRKVSPTETWYRVVIGDFNNKDDALKVIGVLKEKKLLPIFGGGSGLDS